MIQPTPPAHYVHLRHNSIGMKRSALELQEHAPAWSHGFTAERARILSASALRVQVEHVGSTAIPGIRAKPVLDIAVLAQADDLERVATSLCTLGHDYRGPYDERPGRFHAVIDQGNIRLCQLHLYTAPDAGWAQQILFRDVLRADQSLRAEYEAAKLRIQQESGPDKHLYARLKSGWADGFFQKVLRHADVMPTSYS